MAQQLIRVAHSPDSDDAFMFHALANGKLDTGEFQFEHILRDIETLNQWALEGRCEVTAVSFHTYAFLTRRYLLLPHGASMGDGYGPCLVTRNDAGGDLSRALIAVPGSGTTAFLALQLYLPRPRIQVMSFDQILPAVQDGSVDAGLLIHEGQLTFAESGLRLHIDLGKWWHEQTGLPLPLGGNVIRRDLGEQTIARVSRLIRSSIVYALTHREEALDYALRFARGMPRALADRFIGMYVNENTLGYGPRGREAVKALFDKARERGVISHTVALEFAQEEASGVG
ncbi:MAG: ABC transporter substrate-binding protein [Planctomycetes bacterium]|nr:ABC transporter substrate-binding protein [Planctomycetota bacterium]